MTNANILCVKITDATLRAETSTISASFRYIVAYMSSFWVQKRVREDLFDALFFDWGY